MKDMTLFTLDRRIRCCLIQLYGYLQPTNAEPLSIETLASAIGNALPSAIVDLQILGNYQTAAEQNNLLATIQASKYDVIGLSCPQGTYEIASTALRFIYTSPDPPHVVLGNALPTSLPDLFLTDFPHVLIVRGWGETAIVTLCRQIAENCIQLEAVPSLTYLDTNGVRRDTPIEYTEEPAIPSRIEPTRYFARVEASRGYHYNVCTFCSCPPLSKGQPTWRRFDSRVILAQVRQLIEAGITTFTFADEDFLGNDPEGALDLAQKMCDFPGLDFALSVRADNTVNLHGSRDENKLRLRVFQTLKKAGLSLVFIGVESLVASQLQRYGKGISPEQSITAIRLLETLDVELELGLILFDPLLTLEELLTNVEMLEVTGFWRYAGSLFSFLRPQVDTPYEKLLRKRHLLGALKPDTADYEAIYADAHIGEIARYCLEWNRRFKHFYMALRNVDRSEVGTSHFVEEVHSYRYTQLDFLRTLLAYSYEDLDSYASDVGSWHKKVASIAQDINYRLSSISEKTAAESFLSRVILRLGI